MFIAKWNTVLSSERRTKHWNPIRKEGWALILFIKKIKKTKFSSLAPAVRYQQAAHCSIYSELFALSEGAFRTVIISQPLWISNLCKWTYNILHVSYRLCCQVLRHTLTFVSAKQCSKHIIGLHIWKSNKLNCKIF